MSRKFKIATKSLKSEIVKWRGCEVEMLSPSQLPIFLTSSGLCITKIAEGLT